MRMAFATCVTLGRSCIEEVLRIGGGFELLITLKDEKARRKSGRAYLDDIAKKHEIPLLKIDNINDVSVIEALKEYQIDWLFIIGWSQIARKQVLDAPEYGCIGMHPTLLPEGRGRAAIPWAILKGLKKTGVTMFKLDEGVDTGDIIAQYEINLHDKITATELYAKVNQAHVDWISEHWKNIVDNTIVLKCQDDSRATVWPGRKPEDGEVFSWMTMEEADRLVRAVTHPYPGAFYQDDDGLIRIWSAEISPEGGPIKLKDGYLIPVDYEFEGR